MSLLETSEDQRGGSDDTDDGRVPARARARNRSVTWAHVSEDVLISERRAEVADRAVPSHWESQ